MMEGWQVEAEGGWEGRGANMLSAGSGPAQGQWAPSPANTPRATSPSLPLNLPFPAPQANHFPWSRENRGSFQSCSELDAFPQASWSVSRRPGLGRQPHTGCPHLCSALGGFSLSARAPGAAPGQPPGGSPPQPPSALIAATCVPPGTPSPCLQPQPWSLQLQRKHTHTHAQNQLWNVFLLLHGYGCRECSPST